jgi:hypothetical protein
VIRNGAAFAKIHHRQRLALLHLAQKHRLKTLPSVVSVQASSSNQRRARVSTDIVIENCTPPDHQLSASLKRPPGDFSPYICNVVVTRISAERVSTSGQLLPESILFSAALLYLAHKDRLDTHPIVFEVWFPRELILICSNFLHLAHKDWPDTSPIVFTRYLLRE